MITVPSARGVRAVVAVPFLLLAVAGCGQDADPAPEVASLPGSASASVGQQGADPDAETGSDSTGTDGGGRPVLRLDDSDDRRFALWNAHTQCLLDNGAVESSDGMGIALRGGPGGVIPTLEQPVPKAARAACLSIEPVGPLELEASTNPDFHEQSLAYVDCLRRHGEHVRLLNDHDIDWTYIEGYPVPDNQEVFEQECLLEAFGGK